MPGSGVAFKEVETADPELAYCPAVFLGDECEHVPIR